MKNNKFKKIALLGLTTGCLISTQAIQGMEFVNENPEDISTLTARASCGGGRSCGGNNPSTSSYYSGQPRPNSYQNQTADAMGTTQGGISGNSGSAGTSSWGNNPSTPGTSGTSGSYNSSATGTYYSDGGSSSGYGSGSSGYGNQGTSSGQPGGYNSGSSSWGTSNNPNPGSSWNSGMSGSGSTWNSPSGSNPNAGNIKGNEANTNWNQSQTNPSTGYGSTNTKWLLAGCKCGRSSDEETQGNSYVAFKASLDEGVYSDEELLS